jgi:hypothetical protein
MRGKGEGCTERNGGAGAQAFACNRFCCCLRAFEGLEVAFGDREHKTGRDIRGCHSSTVAVIIIIVIIIIFVFSKERGQDEAPAILLSSARSLLEGISGRGGGVGGGKREAC